MSQRGGVGSSLSPPRSSVGVPAGEFLHSSFPSFFAPALLSLSSGATTGGAVLAGLFTVRCTSLGLACPCDLLGPTHPAARSRDQTVLRAFAHTRSHTRQRVVHYSRITLCAYFTLVLFLPQPKCSIFTEKLIGQWC